MKRATEYWPHQAAPDFGGLNGRFGALWLAYHTAPASRLGASLTIALGALAGLVAAWWM